MWNALFGLGGERATGPIVAYVMVDEAPLGELGDDPQTEAEPRTVTRRLESKQVWTLRRIVPCALVAVVGLCAVAFAEFRRTPQPQPRPTPRKTPRPRWRAGIGKGQRYRLKDEEGVNPYAFHLFYENPRHKAEFERSIRSSKGLVRKQLEAMRQVATAVWIDKKALIRGRSRYSLEATLHDAAGKVSARLVTLVLHNLPNRGCRAQASRAEICCARFANGTCDLGAQGRGCDEGLREYREEFVDPVVELLQRYKGTVPVAVILEPDSIPSLVADADNPSCGGAATQHAYREGFRYAADQLAEKTPWVTVYLDAAHGGRLGWPELTVHYLRTLQEMRLPLRRIRGFVTNVAGYQPLGKAACPWTPANHSNAYCLEAGRGEPCCEDPCGMLHRGNPANNELNYAQELVRNAKRLLDMDAHVLTDSSRNGQADARGSCGSSCNVRKAGAGRSSTARVHRSAASFLDAYFWVKTPGESDGCVGTLPSREDCPHQDEHCASEDSLGSKPGEVRPPEAGQWFDYQAKQLAEYSNLGLDEEAQALISMRAQEKDVRAASWV